MIRLDGLHEGATGPYAEANRAQKVSQLRDYILEANGGDAHRALANAQTLEDAQAWLWIAEQAGTTAPSQRTVIATLQRLRTRAEHAADPLAGLPTL